MERRILLIEDERKIAELVSDYLDQYGYQVKIIEDFTRVLEEFTAFEPHLVILDINLPYQDGFYLCRRIRQLSAVPILFLSARQSEMEQIMGIESGGDDYITKPFDIELLAAKVKAIFRRVYGEYAKEEKMDHVMMIGDLVLQIDQMALLFRGAKQTLTKNEVKLLCLLFEQAGRVVTREECLETLWDDIDFVDDNTLTVNIARVRKKLSQWNLGDLIETKRGVGYRFNPSRLKGEE
jgi:DNA-binding response OmpR family regulator